MIKNLYLRYQSNSITWRFTLLGMFILFTQVNLAQNNEIKDYIKNELIGSSFLNNNLKLCDESDIISFIDKERFFKMNIEIETDCYTASIQNSTSEKDTVRIDMYIKKVKRNQYEVMFIKPYYYQKTIINGPYVFYKIKQKKRKTKIIATKRGDF